MTSDRPETAAEPPEAEQESSEGTAFPPGADYRRMRESLTRAVSRICPAGLRDRADDLVQVALMRVAEARRESEGGGAVPSSYLYKAAYSALVDELRRLKRRCEVSIDDETAPVVPEAPDPGPEQRAYGSEIGRAIRECLSLMRKDRRLAVMLYLQGHSVPETAGLLDWSLKRAENLLYRGREDLRRCLGSVGVTP